MLKDPRLGMQSQSRTDLCSFLQGWNGESKILLY